MKIRTDIEQNSLEWLQARSGIPTASEFDNLVTPEFKIRTGQTPATYLNKKLAEAWQGGPLPQFQGIDMEFGHIREEEAVPWFELEYGVQVQRVALVTTDDGRIGCSPDGLIGDAGGLEVKCPAAHTQVEYILAGTLPKDYAAQVHGSLFVTGRAWWKFLSYRRGFPPLVLEVERDDAIRQVLADALGQFLERFDKGMARLCELNGGLPHRKRDAKLTNAQDHP
jgi:hypothetical protein